MRIAIDISPIVYGTGVSVYTKNLVENLLRIDKKNEYILCGGSLRRWGELKRAFQTFKDGVFKGRFYPISPVLADLIWNKFHLFPIETLIGKIDVFHSSDWTQPPSKAFKVTTIHDLVPIKFPKLSHPRIVSTHKARLRWIVREVDRVIVPSRKTAEDAVGLGIKREKIRVIPEAPDKMFKPGKKVEIEKLRRKYKVEGKYLLAVGVNPRKNTDRIIEAFEKVRGESRLKLLITGHKYMDFRPRKEVLFLGHVDNRLMPILYSGSEALIYPSLYEGFGLPILEAFVCSTPVVTSNFGSMAEVAGKAAVLVDPYDVASITEGIQKTLRCKISLIKKGLSRAKDFSWGKVAKKTLDVYQEVRNNSLFI